MIQVPDKIVRELLEVLNEAAWDLHCREEGKDGEYVKDLLLRLRNAKVAFEEKAKVGEKSLVTRNWDDEKSIYS